MKFENRVAVITGAAGRIGLAACRKFAENGVRVALCDRTLETAANAAEKFAGTGADVRPYAMDVTGPASVSEATEKILADFGKVDILVNNAGVWKPSPATEMSEELWEEMIGINLTGTFRVTRAFLKPMIAAQYGRIINLASIAGEVGLPNYSGYAASKGGVLLFSKTLAMEVAKKGVTVNCVSPGMIEDKPQASKNTWLERTGTGDEVARAIVFLASDDAAYITGVDLTVDGGRILGPRFADVP